MHNKKIIWVWDLDDKQFVALIRSCDSFEPPKPKITLNFYRFCDVQDEKYEEVNKDLIDELKRLFGEGQCPSEEK